jgi:hypothetical protein
MSTTTSPTRAEKWSTLKGVVSVVLVIFASTVVTAVLFTARVPWAVIFFGGVLVWIARRIHQVEVDSKVAVVVYAMYGAVLIVLGVAGTIWLIM